MKILHLSKYYPPYQGGIETFLFDLNNSLNKFTNIQSDILCFNTQRNNVTEDSTQEYNIHRSGRLFELARTPISLNYITWLRKNCNLYDIIHLHYPNPTADLALFLSGFKGKVIIHWHSDIVKQKNLEILYSGLRNWIIKRSSKIIATSPEYAEYSYILRKVNDKKVIIPLGLDTKRLGVPDMQKINDLKEKYQHKKIIFSLGRQVYYKGFKYLIESAHFLNDDYIILIGGKGELYHEHEKFILENDLQDRVKMIGFISNEELPNYYAACDIFAMSSIEASEAFGVVQLEAMSFSKPIVSTNIKGSGVGWVNKSGYSGLVVEPGNSKEFASAIIKISKASDDFYGKNAKQRFDDHFTIARIAEETINLYHNILTNHEL